ncbi:MAG: hypothetical protein N2C14_20990 [Planctomycetales bacterium]
MIPFDPTAHGPAVAELLAEEKLNALDEGNPQAEFRTKLSGLTPEKLFAGQSLGDSEMAAACLSGLWLYHDFLDDSHRISQGIQTSTGSYWHGIMHRREGEFSNSKYWFRQTGAHPVFEQLGPDAAEIASEEAFQASGAEAGFLRSQAEWDPFAFVDLCEQCVRGQSNCETLCREIQRREWRLLFDYCAQRALGSA